MYKVFFKDRTVFISKDHGHSEQSTEGHTYRYKNRESLEELVNSFYDSAGMNEFHIIHSSPETLWKEFLSFFHIIQAGGGVVRNPDGQVLIIHRNGLWDLPKGKADSDEGIEETALREVREECGIDVLELKNKITETYHSYLLNDTRVLKRTHWFEMFHPGNEELQPQLEENITEIKWVDPENMEFITTNTFPSIIEVLKKTGISF